MTAGLLSPPSDQKDSDGLRLSSATEDDKRVTTGLLSPPTDQTDSGGLLLSRAPENAKCRAARMSRVREITTPRRVPMSR